MSDGDWWQMVAWGERMDGGMDDRGLHGLNEWWAVVWVRLVRNVADG
jgi:hypothetical protein